MVLRKLKIGYNPVEDPTPEEVDHPDVPGSVNYQLVRPAAARLEQRHGPKAWLRPIEDTDIFFDRQFF